MNIGTVPTRPLCLSCRKKLNERIQQQTWSDNGRHKKGDRSCVTKSLAGRSAWAGSRHQTCLRHRCRSQVSREPKINADSESRIDLRGAKGMLRRMELIISHDEHAVGRHDGFAAMGGDDADAIALIATFTALLCAASRWVLSSCLGSSASLVQVEGFTRESGECIESGLRSAMVFARSPDVVGFSRSCRFDDCQSRRNSGREAPFGCEASSAFLLVPRLRTALEQRA